MSLNKILCSQSVVLGRRIAYFYSLCKMSTFNTSFECLASRSLLRLSGSDVHKFLQSMITNDVDTFNKSSVIKSQTPCHYAMLLNSSGRVLYDCLLYKVHENEYLLEHDSYATRPLFSHLNKFKLRAQVTIEGVDSCAVWSAYEHNFNNSSSNSWKEDIKSAIVVADPRAYELGYRIIVEKNSTCESILLNYLKQMSLLMPYDVLRYKLGIGEGIKDHPPSECLPLETNIDILNGVSFHKGCYLGQEVIARIHFTGVIRKRLMPVILLPEQESYPDIQKDCAIVNERGKRIGRFRSNIGKYGLALLNVAEALKCESLSMKDCDYKIKAIKPKWWPPEADRIIE